MTKMIERRPNDAADEVTDPLAETEPRTKLFAKLLESRARMIADGVSLLTGEEVERGKAERRGGYYVGARDEVAMSARSLTPAC